MTDKKQRADAPCTASEHRVWRLILDRLYLCAFGAFFCLRAGVGSRSRRPGTQNEFPCVYVRRSLRLLYKYTIIAGFGVIAAALSVSVSFDAMWCTLLSIAQPRLSIVRTISTRALAIATYLDQFWIEPLCGLSATSVSGFCLSRCRVILVHCQTGWQHYKSYCDHKIHLELRPTCRRIGYLIERLLRIYANVSGQSAIGSDEKHYAFCVSRWI